MNLTDSFGVIADPGMWEDVVVLGAAFMGGTLLKNTVEGRTSLNVPDEGYGIGIAVGSHYALSGQHRKYAIMGGGLYTADALASRFGIKARVENLGGGN